MPAPLTIAAFLLAWTFASLIAVLEFARMIGANERPTQPFEGSGDARGGGVDQLHGERNAANSEQHHV